VPCAVGLELSVLLPALVVADSYKLGMEMYLLRKQEREDRVNQPDGCFDAEVARLGWFSCTGRSEVSVSRGLHKQNGKMKSSVLVRSIIWKLRSLELGRQK
jgi:hypothetical protein